MNTVLIWLEQTKIAWHYYSPVFLDTSEKQYNALVKPEIEKNAQQREWLINELEKCLREYSIKSQVHILSFLIDITGGSTYCLKLIEIAKNSSLPAETKYFLFYQMQSKTFLNQIEAGIKIHTQSYFLLQTCVEEFKNALQMNLEPISVDDRNKKFVMMITSQFLNDTHGPTKSALGRCIALQKMGYEVLLLNTAELLPYIGAIQFLNSAIGNYVKENTQLENIVWKGHRIPFCQCNQNMPNVETLKYLIGVIQMYKPYFIIEIGHGSILASIANNLIPVLSVGMVFSKIPCSVTDYMTLGRIMREEDRKYLAETGREESTVIEHNFTSDLKEQIMTVKREDIGLKSDDFVLVAVGGRLNEEITDAFWNMIERVMDQEEVKILLLGRFGRTEETTQKYPSLKGKILEFQVEDVRAFMEICDLYVNPIRTGGGTSCVEAMDKAVPVVTTAQGDVAVNAGNSFCTQDYTTMADLILKYKRDKEFYQLKSKEAKKRAEELLDTDSAFQELLSEFAKRADLL